MREAPDAVLEDRVDTRRKGWVVRYAGGGWMVMQVGVDDPSPPFGPFDSCQAAGEARDLFAGTWA